MLFASLVLPCDVCMAGVQHSWAGYLMIIQCSLLRRVTVRRQVVDESQKDCSNVGLLLLYIAFLRQATHLLTLHTCALMKPHATCSVALPLCFQQPMPLLRTFMFMYTFVVSCGVIHLAVMHLSNLSMNRERE